MASEITLKLVVDNKSKKVLFAEASKEFVDFLFSLLTLPIGAVVKLISAGTMQGSIGRLYQSLEDISDTYLLPNKHKAELLHPKVPLADTSDLLLLQGAPESSFANFKLYSCGNFYCGATVTTEPNNVCPQCRSSMSKNMNFVMPSVSKRLGASSSGKSESGGYVKGVMITYIITDNLEVIPMSAISSVMLINRFNVIKEGVQLEEKLVSVGLDEGLALLKAALQSDTVLTDVFLVWGGRRRLAPVPAT